MKDIPNVDKLKSAILEIANTGRSRGVNALEKDVYEKLGLSKEQRKYKIKGSSTALLSNRYKDAISELKKEGALCSPANGKVKLTDYAKQNASHQESVAPQQTAKAETSVIRDKIKDAGKNDEEETLESLGKDFANKLQETVTLKANEVNKSIASKIRDQVDAWDVQALNERLNREYEEKAKAKANNECHDDEVKVEEDGASVSDKDIGASSDSKLDEKIEPKWKYVLPFVLVILGLFLSIAGQMPFAILLCIVVGCMTYFYTQVKQKKVFAPKANYIIGAVTILLSALLIAGGYPNNIQSNQNDSKNQEQAIQQDEQSSKTQTGKLMFIIKAEGDVPDDLVFQVCVNGKTSDDKSVDNDYDATVGTKYQLDNVAGEYEIKVRTTSLTQNDVVYSVPTAKVNFDGENDYTAELTVTKDEEATKALAEKKKEEEAATEAKQKEEQEKAAAEAATQQQQESANANTSSSNDNKTVWVTASGKKYHDEGCRTLAKSKNKSSMTIAEAKAQGYTACGVCAPG